MRLTSSSVFSSQCSVDVRPFHQLNYFRPGANIDWGVGPLTGVLQHKDLTLSTGQPLLAVVPGLTLFTDLVPELSNLSVGPVLNYCEPVLESLLCLTGRLAQVVNDRVKVSKGRLLPLGVGLVPLVQVVE
jgi:hypothetical protein